MPDAHCSVLFACALPPPPGRATSVPSPHFAISVTFHDHHHRSMWEWDSRGPPITGSKREHERERA